MSIQAYIKKHGLKKAQKLVNECKKGGVNVRLTGFISVPTDEVQAVLDKYKNFPKIKNLWMKLSTVEFTNTNCLAEPFHIWGAGTTKEEIEQWFKEQTPESLD